MRILIAFLALSLSAFGSTVNCTNNATNDTNAIVAALAGGGTITVNGTCNTNGGNYNMVANTTLQGGAGNVWNSNSNGNSILNLNNGVTVGGISSGGIVFNGWAWNSFSPLSNVTIANNSLQNSSAGFSSNGMHNWYVGHNTFHNLYPGGYVNHTPPNPTGPNPDTTAPACWHDDQGWDASVVTSNIFDQCYNDGFHINPHGSITSTNSSELSYNVCTNIYRACYELQAFASNMVIKGNVAYKFNMPNWNSFAYSIASVGTNLTLINNYGNLSTDYCTGGLATYIEDFIGPGTIQSNVEVGVPANTSHCVAGAGGPGWEFYTDNLGSLYPPGTTNTLQNNVMCGNIYQVLIGHETPPSQNFVIVDQFNYKNSSSCPVGALDTSNISAPVFTAAAQTFPSGGSGTWNITQLSWLPVRWEQWYIDNIFQGTQELQDINTNFASDLKYKYHATFNTSTLSSGTHTIKFIATDVFGVTNTASQTFTVGSVSGPSVTLAPTSVAFGTVLTGSTSSPTTVVLSNIGTSVLNITSKTFTGTNSGDFSIASTTCSTTLAAGSSCNMAIDFTPGGLGPRTASLSIVDNATGSPHTVPLTGTGVTVASCTGLLLNCEFISGMANWTGNTSPYGTWTTDNSGPGGITAAHFTITSVITSGHNVELLQNGVTLGANGTTYNLTFKANTTRSQQLNIRGVDSSVFTDYGLTCTPTITPGWQTYSCPFTVINSPPSGAALITWQMDNANPGDQNYFTDMQLVVNAGSTEVNNITFPFVDHGSLSVQFTTLTSSIGARVRYVASPGVCTGGTGGRVQINQLPSISSTYASLPVGGLAPSTTYNVCPEVTKDNVTWSTGAGSTVTTLSLPGVHPAAPIDPLDFDETYPNVTTGPFPYVTDNNTGTDCAGISGAYSSAVARWATTGTIINLPPGTVCAAPGGPYALSSLAPDIHIWQPSDVDTSTGEIEWMNHGLSEGDLVSFGRTYASLTTYPASASCDIGTGSIGMGGIQSGQRYVAHVTDLDHFQVHCLPTTPAPLGVTPLPTPLMTFTTQGSSSTGGFYVVPWHKVNGLWQRNRIPWIIIRSSAPDSQLPPQGTQITPAWAPKMAKFVDPVSKISNSPSCFACSFLIFGDTDPNIEKPIGNIRIGPGIEITTADYATSVHTSDPRFWNFVVLTQPWDTSIVFDRVWYHMLGAPNREQTGLYWNGSNMGIVDSAWDNLTYFHAAITGLTLLKTSGTTFTIASGTAYYGSGSVNLPSTDTVTISGSGSGRVRAYYDLLNSNALTVSVPAGITASCAPTTCVTTAPPAGSPSGICNAVFNNTDPVNYTENVGDLWPKTASGEATVAQIGCADVTTGSITTAGSANPGVSAFNPEGDNHMSGGWGPGPYKMLRNYSDGAGIPWFFDDSGSATYRGNYLIAQNYFHSDLKYMHGSSTSDNLFYFMRQPFEMKGGQFMNFIGNIMDGAWREDTPDGSFMALTPVVGGWASDINIQFNTFRHGEALLEGINGTCSGSTIGCAKPGTRYWFTNNLIYDIDGYKYQAHNPNGSNAAGFGSGFQILGVQDWKVDHNTWLVNKGGDPQMAGVDGSPIEGFQWTNNFNWYSGVPTQITGNWSIFNYPPNGCTGADVTYINCWATSGISNTLYNMGHNVISGGYTDTSVPIGQTTTVTMSTAFTGLTNSFVATGTVPATITAIKWSSATTDNILFNYHLSYDSPWNAGSNPYDGHASDIGADIDRLNQIQGLTKLISMTYPLGVPTVNYFAPDIRACTVLLSTTNDISSTSQIKGAGGVRGRSTALPGLASQTLYYGWLTCPGNAMQAQRSFSFKTH